MDGTFKRFASQLRFDPAVPQAAKALIEVDLASVDTGCSEGDAEVATKTWFNTPAFPTARFESTGVKAIGGNQYEVAGKLRCCCSICRPTKRRITEPGVQPILGYSFRMKLVG